MSAVASPPQLQVEPRIAQRRAEVAFDRRRRRRRLLVALAGVLCVAALLFGVARSALADVDAVLVSGAAHTDVEEVRRTSGIAVGDQLMDLDPARSARAIESLPWVAGASVERGWLSGEVLISVVERTPVAMVQDVRGTNWLVDEDGRVLDIGPAQVDPTSGDTPVIVVAAIPDPGGHLDDAAMVGVEVALALTPGVATRVARVVVDDRSEALLELQPNGSVLFGQQAELEVKVRTLQSVFASVDLSCLAVIDLSVADTAVLTREDGCA